MGENDLEWCLPPRSTKQREDRPWQPWAYIPPTRGQWTEWISASEQQDESCFQIPQTLCTKVPYRSSCRMRSLSAHLYKHYLMLGCVLCKMLQVTLTSKDKVG